MILLCQRCNEHEASVHLTKIINNKKTELYLCEECARELGHMPLNTSDPFSFQNLLSGILNPGLSSAFNREEEIKCESCGITYNEFTKTGLMGCSDCYDAFDENLIPLIKRIHGSNNHTGKVPKRKGGDLRIIRKIEDLREEMQRVVEEENFERAAEIRDEINELEKKLGED